MWRVVLTVALLCWRSEGQITCKDESGNKVDWYILYKKPCDVTYFYMDSNGLDMISNIRINHQAGVLARTLEPYFSKPPGSGYIAYNDQPPPNTPSAGNDCGHSKGLVMMDKTTGFWLLHSTPRFPYGEDSNNFYPPTGKRFGQTFICVTFPYATFETIGKHLTFIKAHPFKHDIPGNFHKTLQDAAESKLTPNTLNILHEDLKSEGGQLFRRFVKKTSNDEKGDLYVTIAENIKSDLDTQTWGGQKDNSPNYLPQTGQKVYNVESVEIDKEKWKRGRDHSKWCVSKDKIWTCFADVNRSLSQYKRPGGALCINNKAVTNKFGSFIRTDPVPDADTDYDPDTSSDSGSDSDLDYVPKYATHKRTKKT